MTAPQEPTREHSQELETQEELRARISDLERQLAEARSSHAAEARIGSTALIALGVVVLLETPLALATLKRFVDWWRE
jgi:hypothetical protein